MTLMAEPTQLLVPGPTDQSYKVFMDRYALTDIETGTKLEDSYEQMWQRVATAMGTSDREATEFYDLLKDFKFVPGGRTLYAAGQGNRATLANCYVYDIDDSRESIFGTLGEAMSTLAKGGGVGYNFSKLRPSGTPLRRTGGIASGPNSFITMYNAAARTIVQGGSRRAAQMGQLNIDHPEIMDFMTFKKDHSVGIRDGDSREWNHFNVSVAVNTNPRLFLDAVNNDANWRTSWDNRVFKDFSAKEMWDTMIHSAWESGDPGLFFLERAQYWNNTKYCEEIVATNPCGEIPLPDGGACFLGSINLVSYLRLQEDGKFRLLWGNFVNDARLAVRFLNRVIDNNEFPTERSKIGLKTRRIGLGLMGLTDAATLLGIPYDSEGMVVFTETVYEILRDASYDASVEMASEEGSFPDYDPQFLNSPFILGLSKETQQDIRTFGIRNGHLMTQAPTGSIAVLAGVSSGLEPNFSDVWLHRDNTGSHIVAHPLRPHSAFRKANEISPIWHLRVQEAAQQYIDQSVSKTINLPNSATEADVDFVYRYAFEHNFKGITVFRDGSFDGQWFHIELCPMCEETGSLIQLSKQDGCTVCPTCDYKGVCSI